MKAPWTKPKAPDALDRSYRKSPALAALEAEMHGIGAKLEEELIAAFSAESAKRGGVRGSAEGFKAKAITDFLMLPSTQRQIRETADAFLSGVLSSDKAEILTLLEKGRDWLEESATRLSAEMAQDASEQLARTAKEAQDDPGRSQ